MEITIDLESCKIIVCIKRYNRYAIFVNKLTGEAINMTIPELITSLYIVASEEPQP